MGALHPRRRAQAAASLLALLVILAPSACADVPDEGASTTTHPIGSTSTTTTGTTSSTTAATTTPAPPTFTWQAQPIDAALRTRMAASWHPGCPVPLDSLRHVSLSYWGFDGTVRPGELVIHADAVEALEQAFSSLFDQRFPIRSMLLVDDFGGDDDRSMAADNTSAFNCRRVAGSSHWSQHAFGHAVDINPVENPYIHRGIMEPPAAADYVDRAALRPGMLVAGSPAVAAFTAVGWGWGGTWGSPDHQHVSATGS